MRERKKCVPLHPLSRENASKDDILRTAGTVKSILSCKQTREREIASAVRTENFFKNFSKKFGGLKNPSYLCKRFSDTRKRQKKRVLWKTLYRQTRKNVVRGVAHYMIYNERNETRNRQLLNIKTNWRSASCEQKNNFLKIFYKEEFDPGSGWTLATGLTHASRGAACWLLATNDGDRRTGE